MRFDIPSSDPPGPESESPSSRGTSPALGGRGSSRESSFPPAGSPANSSVGHKRGAESQDLSQYALVTTRRVRLKPADAQELMCFSKLTSGERDVFIAAQMFKLQEKLGSLQPADSLYALPKSLADHIDRYTFSFLMCPTLPSYVGKQATNLILDMLGKNPASGWPVDIGHSKAKMDVIKSRVQTKLTERRNQMKGIILASLGEPAAGETEKETTLMEPRTNSTNIVALCEDLVGIYKGVSLKVTIQMCSRVAALRDVMISSGDVKSASQSFWPAVDKELQGVRDKYPVDAKKRSRIFAKNLTNDRRLFGQADVDALHDVTESIAQQEADQLVSGSTITLFALPDDMAAADGA